ncbi:YciI family protein [Thermomonospora cellulosilytica]|uniref:YCII-related domain-containing protein n=1 Tax=Thermomonospora cellulosilytica TaxID=1411118 RepID=A0A7W3R750_9ACTN|nr:YciI family protein [Thermomonospora cellulosilytica]MBA9002114.1 hypothetical protein [Thermomonospora cellulosilytica]
MRYLMTSLPSDTARKPDEKLHAEVGAFVEELTAAGVLLATGGLDSPTVTTSRDGEFTVTDGPFAEAKEVAVSFALVDVRSKEEAIEISRRFFQIIGDGTGYIQQVL